MKSENTKRVTQANPSSENPEEDFGQYCRVIEDFPKPGISFKDITTLLLDAKAFNRAINTLCSQYVGKVEFIVCIEARGFLIGAPMAYVLNCGLIPVRKKGKLPSRTLQAIYELEYGTDTLEIHADAIKPGQRILIVDDILATGGTAKSVVELIQKMKGDVIGCAFLGELTALNGRNKLGVPVYSLIKF
ncbi:MAG TPA: adenine phosphoribosyltransferase [Dehalococcoidales bacterium]|nr:adenine phosphoribosyltransferase [Dehalococcoidales bacterium]